MILSIRSDVGDVNEVMLSVRFSVGDVNEVQ